MSIPAIKDLLKVGDICDTLGFRKSSDRPHRILQDSTKDWRLNWRTKHGKSGSELLDWYSLKDQSRLQRMVTEYLDEGGYGEKFWSTNNQDLQPGIPVYPEDKIRYNHYNFLTIHIH